MDLDQWEVTTLPVDAWSPPDSSTWLEAGDLQEVPQADVVCGEAGAGGRVETGEAATPGTESGSGRGWDQVRAAGMVL